MPDVEELLEGTLHWFADWPVRLVPSTGSIVYMICDCAGDFVYVGLAGKSAASPSKSKGPFGRLVSHANRCRSSDQFNVYVCDRFVLPRIHTRILEIAAGTLSLDQLTRESILTELGFRFMVVASPSQAFLTERQLQLSE